MFYKLIEAAQSRWHAVNTPHLAALVRNGATFHRGVLLERPFEITRPQPTQSSNAEIEVAQSRASDTMAAV